MSSYYISPETETKLEVEPSVLKEGLTRHWPTISIKDVNKGNRLFIWGIPKMRFGSLEGYLDVTKQVVILDGDVRDCAEFAVWYRPLVAEACQLVFYDEAYTSSVPLRPDTSADQIAASFLSAGESQN